MNLIYHTQGTNRLDKQKLLVIDNYIDYRKLDKKDIQQDIHTNQLVFLCFDRLKSRYNDYQGFDELHIVHKDKTFWCKFPHDSGVLEHNFNTARELRFAHNLRRLFLADGLGIFL